MAARSRLFSCAGFMQEVWGKGADISGPQLLFQSAGRFRTVGLCGSPECAIRSRRSRNEVSESSSWEEGCACILRTCLIVAKTTAWFVFTANEMLALTIIQN